MQSIKQSSLAVRVAALILLGLVAVPAVALYPQLSCSLSGPAINGVVPQGQVKVDQSKLPKQRGMLQVRVRNVNLPNGVVLDIELGGRPLDEFGFPGHNVGAMSLNQRQASLFTTIPFEVARQEDIVVRNRATGVIVLFNTAPWKT
jgi:hypothetical protein